MKWSLGFIVTALLCGGCAVYADPPGAGVYVAPPPAVVVEPGGGITMVGITRGGITAGTGTVSAGPA